MSEEISIVRLMDGSTVVGRVKISPEIILEHCVEKGIFMGSIQKRWVGDLDFILNLLKRKLILKENM